MIRSLVAILNGSLWDIEIKNQVPRRHGTWEKDYFLEKKQSETHQELNSSDNLMSSDSSKTLKFQYKSSEDGITYQSNAFQSNRIYQRSLQRKNETGLRKSNKLFPRHFFLGMILGVAAG